MDTYEERQKVINQWIIEAEGMNQKEFLTHWWRLVLEYPALKYEMLSIITKYGRGRKEPYPRKWLKVSRAKFDKNNLYKKRYGEQEICFLHPHYDKPHPAYAKHHIVKLSAWGTNHRLNIVTLCYRCHAYFHPWLWKSADLHEQSWKERDSLIVPRVIAPRASTYHS